MTRLLARYSRHGNADPVLFFEFLSTGKTLGPPAAFEEASTRWGKPAYPNPPGWRPLLRRKVLNRPRGAAGPWASDVVRCAVSKEVRCGCGPSSSKDISRHAEGGA